MSERGAIRNEDFAKQLVDFSGLVYGKISPTDVDLYIDFQNRVFVFGEYKFGKTLMEFGQRLALERLCDEREGATRKTIGLVASHRTPATQQVDGAAAVVTEFRFKKKWRVPKHPITVRQAIDSFLGKIPLAEIYEGPDWTQVNIWLSGGGALIQTGEPPF